MTSLSSQQETSAAPSRTGGSGSGQLFIMSAPSGTGKTTLCRLLRQRFPDLRYSVSHTTRSPRDGEQDGKDYHFINTDQFRKKIDAGLWAEWAEVHGNYYGTSAEFIDRQLAAGRHVLLDIDVQGAAQIRSRYPDSISIFIMPPTMDTLKQRLTARGTDNRATVEKRLRAARHEMDRRQDYQYIVVNDQLERAIEELSGIVNRHSQGG